MEPSFLAPPEIIINFDREKMLRAGVVFLQKSRGSWTREIAVRCSRAVPAIRYIPRKIHIHARIKPGDTTRMSPADHSNRRPAVAPPSLPQFNRYRSSQTPSPKLSALLSS